MIKVEVCVNCSWPTFTESMAGIRLKADPSPLDAQEATTALLSGLELYRYRLVGPTLTGASTAVLRALATAEPGERPTVLKEHRCPKAPGARLPAPQQEGGPTPQPDPPSRPVAPQTAFWGPKTAPSGVPGADRPRSEAGTTADRGVIGDLGELIVWARWLDEA